MKKAFKTMAVTLAFIIGGQVYAQDTQRTAEQVFNAYKGAEYLNGLEIRAKIAKGEMPEIWGPPGPNIELMSEAEKTLDTMRASGNPLAAFYAGSIKHASGVRLADTSFPSDGTRRMSNEFFKEALARFKQAGEAGKPGGFFNAALMYREGQGVTRSKLAASEWFYKASVGHLKFGDREHALASLEAMQEIDANSVLVKRLGTMLTKGMPN